MGALLKKPVPALWLKLRNAFHQDWIAVNHDKDLNVALYDNFIDWFSNKERVDLLRLVESFMDHAQSTGDYKKAWRLSGASIYLLGKPQSWFGEMTSDLRQTLTARPWRRDFVALQDEIFSRKGQSLGDAKIPHPEKGA